jgi:hypothetical protein
MSQLILGSLEKVNIPKLGVQDVLAKIDTGAFSGAMHCEDVYVERRNGNAILHFTPLGNTLLATSTEDFKRIIVRSANGHESVRYLIKVEFELHGKTYLTTIGLTSRLSMRREILLGRRFLLEHNAIVDVGLTKDLDDEAERL